MDLFDHPLVLAADAFAAAAHSRVGQVQPYTGLPYIEHPREVARLVARYLPFPVAIAGALVHDCIADTAETKVSIALALGDEVALLADELAEKYQPGWNRRQKSDSEFARLSTISVVGKGIKCADNIVNISSIVERAPKFAKIYVPEKRRILPALLGSEERLYLMAVRAIETAERQLAGLDAAPSTRKSQTRGM